MGLDITWHTGLTKANFGEGIDRDGDVEDGFFRFYVNTDFPGRADEIVGGAAYRSEENGHFRAGSYGGYNRWREQLAALVGKNPYAVWQDPQPGPFVELINFTDCDGVIGAAASKKLAADFAAHQAQADAHPDNYFRERYAAFRNAFERAAENGCVVFH